MTLCVLALACTPALAAFDPAAAQSGAQEVAAGYWGATPCGGDITISWAALDSETNAASSWDNPVGAYDDPARNSACEITFNSTLDWDNTMFCTIMVHEYGHLTGHPHSSDPTDVMYPFYEWPVAQCAPPARAAAPPARVAARPAPRHRARNTRSHRPGHHRVRARRG